MREYLEGGRGRRSGFGQLPVECIEDGFGRGHHRVASLDHCAPYQVVTVFPHLGQRDFYGSQLRSGDRLEIEGKARGNCLQRSQGGLPH